ncbi:MAG: hypothetical protein FWD71_19145 [Oscillospiraceae bacterium]|nr:hypothetical protein [Oscillospiraceae bacterium]
MGFSQKRGFGTLPDKQKPKRDSVQVLTEADDTFSKCGYTSYACKRSFSPYYYYDKKYETVKLREKI